MSGRYRTVALQAVGVAVLAAFIFVAFLRPSEPGDLSGIDAPGSGDSPTVATPPDDDKDKRASGTGRLGRPANGDGSRTGACIKRRRHRRAASGPDDAGVLSRPTTDRATTSTPTS